MVAPGRFFAEGFSLGLSTGTMCLATCGPVYAPFLMQWSRRPLRYFMAVIELSIGRFLAYLAVGAIAGQIGGSISDLQRDYFIIIAYPLFSAFLVISALRSFACEKGCAPARWGRFTQWPLLLGILTGINVCPSFMLAFSRSISLSGPCAGMLFFAAFFLGTGIFIIPLSFVGMLGMKKTFRSIGRIAAFLVAAWFTASAAYTAYGMVRARFDPRPVICLLDDKPLYLSIDNLHNAHATAAALAMRRSGPVHAVKSHMPVSAPYYVLADSAAAGSDSLKKPGRFLIIADKRYFADSAGNAFIIEFLRTYHFRFNAKTGDVFFLR